MGLLDWMTDPNRTQQLQGIGNNLKGAIEQLKQHRGLLDAAVVDTKKYGFGGNTPAQQAYNNSVATGVVNSIGPLMFIGKGAKTWNAAAASKAQELLDAGVNPRQIWSETGTWKGPDGHLRQEIPDNAAALKTDPLPRREIGGKMYEDFKMPDALLHDALYEAYPNAKTISGSFDSSGRFGGAYTGGLMDSIQFDQGFRRGIPSADQLATQAAADAALSAHTKTPRYKRLDSLLDANIDNEPEFTRIFEKYGGPAMEQKTSSLAKAANAARDDIRLNPEGGAYLEGGSGSGSAKSVALHELQHAIQEREGWARGGSTREMGDQMGRLRQLNEQFNDAFAQYMNPVDEIQKSNARQAMDYLQKQIEPLRDLRGAIHPDDAYMRLAGEAEARATQARMNMDATQRRATFPEDSYDVPIDQLIIRGGLLGR